MTKQQHHICGVFTVLKPFVQHWVDLSFRKQVFVDEAPFALGWVLSIIFTVRSEGCSGTASAPLVSWWLHQFLVVPFQCPAYSLQYLDHFPLVYVRQNINGILLQPTAFVCSLNSLKCQTSGNFTFQNTGLLSVQVRSFFTRVLAAL